MSSNQKLCHKCIAPSTNLVCEKCKQNENGSVDSQLSSTSQAQSPGYVRQILIGAQYRDCIKIVPTFAGSMIVPKNARVQIHKETMNCTIGECGAQFVYSNDEVKNNEKIAHHLSLIHRMILPDSEGKAILPRYEEVEEVEEVEKDEEASDEIIDVVN